MRITRCEDYAMRQPARATPKADTILRMQPCKRQAQLQNAAVPVREHLDELSEQPINALRDGNYNRVLSLDEKMENYFGKKERAFGALFNHCREHGCSFDALMD